VLMSDYDANRVDKLMLRWKLGRKLSGSAYGFGSHKAARYPVGVAPTTRGKVSKNWFREETLFSLAATGFLSELKLFVTFIHSSI
jgi:hypothetical protein